MSFKLSENFKDIITKFLKDNHVKMNDPEFYKIFRNWFEHLSKTKKLDNEYGREYDNKSLAYEKLKKFQQSLVQQCIEFINNNEDIKTMIENKREDVYNEWNKDSERSITIIPDTRFTLNIDGFDESIRHGEWVPATDSCVGISVGNVNILDVM